MLVKFHDNLRSSVLIIPANGFSPVKHDPYSSQLSLTSAKIILAWILERQ